ncbi:hypothetical protein TPHA_0E02760 [Tetrapisispora phaffii CBS 4417]|uniref:BAH domain-containing protein n=1 Tax=Tetrapisispora phaffii (strain ATCC 24235 / CBS 4417 / NBRC 1672 / NRRL Y-8282 / UCD 70-5) TaxID=1071381 RepID=G8BTY8_TETPH|nr:hypothetical protein TPHA_0E02760 [Tetrapisispora phaffii CBS 4417]CCE63366.1 hypothetical protein TPHA_0E02760 [Tetrapisispora phaffii CBS 4417]
MQAFENNNDVSVLMNINKAVADAQNKFENTNRDHETQSRELNEDRPWNFIPAIPPSFRKDIRFSNILDLDDSIVDFHKQCLLSSDNNVLLDQNDTIYTVATSPGEPYYIGRVVGFEINHAYKDFVEKSLEISEKLPSNYFVLRMNWFYRPRDIGKLESTFDPRRLYATQMEDIVPIESFRGKCVVSHELELIDKIPSESEVYIRPNIFYYKELYDIYTDRFYTVLPTDMLLHMFTNSSYLYVLNRKVRYIFTEKDFPIEHIINKYITVDGMKDKSNTFLWDNICTVCKEWCSSTDYTNCDECNRSIHKVCIEPLMQNKLNNDIVWLCNICMKREDGNKDNINEAKTMEINEKKQNLSYKRYLESESLKVFETTASYNKENYWFYYFGKNTISDFKTLLDWHLFLPYPITLKNNFNEEGNLSTWSSHPYNNDTLANLDDLAEFTTSNVDPNIPHPELETFLGRAKEILGKSDSGIHYTSEEIKTTLSFFFEAQDFDIELALITCGVLFKSSFFMGRLMTIEELEKFKRGINRFGNELQLVQIYIGSCELKTIIKYFSFWKDTIMGNSILNKYSIENSPRKIYLSNTRNTDDKNNIKDLKALISFDNLLKYSSELAPKYINAYIDDSSVEMGSKLIQKNEPDCSICQTTASYMWYKHTRDSQVIEKLNPNSPNTRVLNNFSSINDLICIRCARLWRRYAVIWQHPVSVFAKLLEGTEMDFTHYLTEMLEESNDNYFISSAIQAHKKLIEYELVQDSEMIFRQREKMCEDPNFWTKYNSKITINRRLLSRQTRKKLTVIQKS